MYIERWLTAPAQLPDGSLEQREKGTPQGGVISPLLANLFLHYAFDEWMHRNFPTIEFERYADDMVVHCRTQTDAESLREAIADRMRECKLELHPEKTKIVYCKAFEQNLKNLRETYEEAKRQGDKALMAKCEKEGESQQARLHRQGFSTAPVGDILAHIQDRMADILREAGVSRIVSKWDEATLAKHAAAERVDVTGVLIKEFNPNERQLNYAIQIQEKDPIPLDELEKMLEKEEP